MEENTITIVECRKLRKLIRDIKIEVKVNNEEFTAICVRTLRNAVQR